MESTSGSRSDGEKFLALDGKTYSLTPDNLVIADQERAVGIGGVMGGEETGVTESTKNILLESRLFFAGKYSPDGARFKSAKRCELSIRAWRGSGNDFARVAARN